MNTGRKLIGPRNREIMIAHPVWHPTVILSFEGIVAELCHVKASNGLSSQYVVRGVMSSKIQHVTDLVHQRIIEKGAVRASASATM